MNVYLYVVRKVGLPYDTRIAFLIHFVIVTCVHIMRICILLDSADGILILSAEVENFVWVCINFYGYYAQGYIIHLISINFDFKTKQKTINQITNYNIYFEAYILFFFNDKFNTILLFYKFISWIKLWKIKTMFDADLLFKN